MKLTQDEIRRIARREARFAVQSGGGSYAGGVSEAWIADNFISKDFFNRVFTIHAEGSKVILPNDTDTAIKSIEAKAGLWTEKFISALGKGDSGGGGGATALADLVDVDISAPTGGQVLAYDSLIGKWTAQTVAQSLAGLSDVSLANPSDGQALVYNSASGQWTAQTINASFTAFSNASDSQHANQVMITVGSTTKYLLIGYAASAGSASYATSAGSASSASRASYATSAGSAGTADSATNATYAAYLGNSESSYTEETLFYAFDNVPSTDAQNPNKVKIRVGSKTRYLLIGYAASAGSAGTAGYATSAGSASTADSATNATYATYLGNSSEDTLFYAFDNVASTDYQNPNKVKIRVGSTTRYLLIGYATSAGSAGTAGYATSAGSADSADYATSAGSADSADYATSAGRLSGTGSYSAWGQTFWANGVPKSIISGSLNLNGKGNQLIFKSGYYITTYDNIMAVATNYTEYIAFTSDGQIYTKTGVYSEGYVTALSDERRKDIMTDIAPTACEVAGARAVAFVWKDRPEAGVQAGAIAQDWQRILPQVVRERDGGELSLDYGVAALLSVIGVARELVQLRQQVKDLQEIINKTR